MRKKALFNVNDIRTHFPMLRRKMNGKRFVYLDNAATTQKPKCVIDRMSYFLRNEYATVHRGIYTFSQESTKECERVREACRRFLNARQASEIIFTKGTTEGINLVARGLRQIIQKGDEILISGMEHHSNIVPWQRIAEETEAVLKVIPVSDQGELCLDEFEKLLSSRTRLVSVCHVSNALGTINPVEEIIMKAHRVGALVLVDGAQAAAHLALDVQALGCDFYCFSGHKLYGPNGIGVLYGRAEHLERMEPYQFGGDMIETVTFEKTTFAKPPAKFEAGTPPITEIVGMGAALEFLETVGFGQIHRQESLLLKEATQQLSDIQGLKIIGQAKRKASLVSFTLEGIHPHDVGTVLNEQGIAVRAGHHCAQPLMRRFGLTATTRASFALCNTTEEVGILAKAVKKVFEVFR